MKILSNVTIKKRKEYSQSYGGVETIQVPFLKDFGGEVQLLDACGCHVRIMRTGTKLLIEFKGTEITERTFNGRTKKNQELAKTAREKSTAEREAQINRIQQIADAQLEKWASFLAANPEKVTKYTNIINTLSSTKWRSILKMKAAKHINEGKFDSLEVSPAQLRDVLFNINQ